MLKSILTVLIVVQSIFSSDLKFSFDGDLGYVPKTISQAYIYPANYKFVALKEVFFIALSPRLEWKFIYGSLDFSSYSCKYKDNIGFAPFRTVFKNEIGLFHDFKNNIRLSLAWDHLCGHRTVTSVAGNEKFDLYDNMYDKVFLRFSYKN